MAALGAHFTAALVALRADTRSFEFVLTYDRATVVDVVAAGLARVRAASSAG